MVVVVTTGLLSDSRVIPGSKNFVMMKPEKQNLVIGRCDQECAGDAELYVAIKLSLLLTKQAAAGSGGAR